jgi:hypothetical protein
MFSTAQQFAIDKYRSFFSMRTQLAGGSSFKLSNRLGDEELWEDLRLGLNFFNSAPPIVTTTSFQELYDASASALAAGQDPLAPESESTLSIYISAVFMCAMFFTGTRLEWFEAGKHFRYNDNGISIERVKQPDYQNVVGSSVLQFITAVLPGLRKTLGFERINIKGQFSGMISFPRSLTRGLRGTRLGAG